MNNILIKMNNIFNIDNPYLSLLIISLIVLAFFKIIAKIIVIIYKSSNKNSKNLFIFNQRINIITNIIIFLVLFLTWEKYLKSLVTLISFISAGLTIAVKDIIVNLFAGLYISVRKPFKLEDRIEINDMKGDVVALNSMSFKILEIGDRINGEQSSGIIINIPNSFIFNYALKNYTTAFKYIWDEMIINIDLSSDVNKNKKEILKIINNNEVIKTIPKKMNQAVEDASLEYRIYYNHLEPIIYTKIIDNHIELDARFLVHPKKVRNVEDSIWLNILQKYHENKIDLYQSE